MRRKNPSRFPICTKLSAKEATESVASFKPTLTPHVSQGTHLDRKKSKIIKTSKQKKKKVLVGRVKNIFVYFPANQVSDRLQETL